MRTLKQRWQSERCFQRKGDLSVITATLRRIAHSPSTLPFEALYLEKALSIVGEVRSLWDTKEHRQKSLELFERRLS